MATTKTQRIGIWVIAAFMMIGTVGSFAIIILSNKNTQTDQKRLQELTTQYQNDTAAYNAKVATQTKQLSEQYFATFNAFSSRVGTFDASSVSELKTEDLVVGSGNAITTESSFSAYYIGWKADGTIFDSSISDGALKAPIAVTPGGVIQGWTKGADGMKVGGARELTIPSSLAYGEAGSGETIPANTPLKFVVMIIPTPEVITAPTMPAELLHYYQTGRLQ